MCGGAIISDFIPSPVARQAGAHATSVWLDNKSKRNRRKSMIDNFEEDFSDFEDFSDIDDDSEFGELEDFDVKPFEFSSGTSILLTQLL
jgi:EREBP-like factor